MIDKIIEGEDKKEMIDLSYMLEDVICELKEYDYNKYKHYKMKLYEMAYGCVLSEEMAEEIVENMKPYHEHWTMEQTNSVKNEYGIKDKIRDIDFYVVMNSAYNDFKELFDEDLDKYVEYTKLFILDEDAEDGKVYKYYTTIPKRD
jgi:hypothetical protein